MSLIRLRSLYKASNTYYDIILEGVEVWDKERKELNEEILMIVQNWFIELQKRLENPIAIY